jgi:nicotinamide mononucleotide transporter
MNISEMTEYAAAFFGAVGVFLNTRQNRWGFLFGFFSVTPYIVIFATAGLLGNAALSLYFAVMCVRGWFFWRENENPKAEVKSGKMKPKDYLTVFFLIFLTAVVLAAASYFGSDFYEAASANLLWLDILTVSLSVAAQFLLTKAKKENWYFWIVVNIFSFVLFYQSGLYATALLYILYFFLACYGAFRWK